MVERNPPRRKYRARRASVSPQVPSIVPPKGRLLALRSSEIGRVLLHRTPRRPCSYMAAAWLMASGTRSSARTRLPATSISGSDPSFFSRSTRASVSAIGPTSIVVVTLSVSFSLGAYRVVVSKMHPFWLCGRYDASGLLFGVPPSLVQRVRSGRRRCPAP